ncbi:MAG: hypothetical protein MUF54_00760 [Polyangiaceae bacterium]|nr:hypothetical protein [Polyangiaceae bacterium]
MKHVTQSMLSIVVVEDEPGTSQTRPVKNLLSDRALLWSCSCSCSKTLEVLGLST